MKITRTANAGVLLELDGVRILMDGVCREVKPYPATPPEVKQRLLDAFPDVVAFTHSHKDHYDPAYAAEYIRQTGRAVFAPEGLRSASMTAQTVNGVHILPVTTRHIGAAGKDTPHTGFVIKGSRCIWFTGDSSPAQWKGRVDLPKPDVIIVPYAYCNTQSSWTFTKGFGAHIVLLHMPEKENDILGLWDAVERVVKNDRLLIPGMLETIVL